MQSAVRPTLSSTSNTLAGPLLVDANIPRDLIDKAAIA